MQATEWIHSVVWKDLPEAVRHQARRCLLDTLGAAIGGRQTELSHIIHNFAALAFGGQGAHLWLDGREVSPPGAALANGMTIDALDIHDGYAPVKGHAGAALVPALLSTLSFTQKEKLSGRALLTTLVVGYEIALRAGLALHSTACDYHTSGAWNALGCAAMVARNLGLTPDQTRHALGIAEYHGPRSQMMRCIDHPTMLKDGSGWGAMAGVSAALMAQTGFTGAPALTAESAEVADFWADLDQRWLMLDQYFKPHAVCRWAQPALEGALTLYRSHKFSPESVQRIQVFTFHEATRLICRHPENTEQAQYSLPFSVAAALVHGQLGPAELSGDELTNPAVLKLANRVEMVEEKVYNAHFPALRLARVKIETTNGQHFDSGDVQANWDIELPATDAELRQKFRWLAQSSLPESRAKEIEDMVWRCIELPDASQLATWLALPPQESKTILESHKNQAVYS